MDIKQKYGKLTILREAESYILPSGQKNKAFLCKCDCGNEKIVRKLHLVRNRISSCGCIVRTKNGLTTHPLYKVWQAILLRTSGHYNDVYRKKQINVCDEWRDYETFYHWSIGNGYKKGLQIDRIDNSLGYSPLNCRYVSQFINMNNRDNTFFVIYKGEKIPFMFLLDRKGLKNHEATIRIRLKRGWSCEDAFDKKIREGNYLRKAVL
jgi:hypothetical protein